MNAVSDLYRPFPADQDKFGGLIAARLRANSEGFIEKIAETLSDGAGATAGTLLNAAAYVVEYTHDAHTNAIMVRLAHKLIASQAPDGFFGTRTSAGAWTQQEVSTQNEDLLGILNYYRLTGDQAAITAATKLGNLLVEERRKTSIFAGALQSMVQLFRYSDDNRYLQFCNAVAEDWQHKKPPRLPVTFENLAVLNGLVELYRINGDNSVFTTPVQSWTEMQASGLTLTGIPAGDPQQDSQASNACVTREWLLLSTNLLRITGQSVYADQIERTVYNQLFAGQDVRTGAVLAPVAWSGKKEPVNSSACAASEVLALAQVPSVIWGRYGNGLVVNLYTEGHTIVRLRRRGNIQLYSETTYPETGTMLLHVEPDHPLHFPLRLRVPEWTSKFTADVGVDHFVGKPSQYLTLNRGWKRGDTVRISMAMDARVIPGIREFSDDVAIARGPEVLALGKTLNPGITDLSAAGVQPSGINGLELSPVTTIFTSSWMGDQAYELKGTYEGQARKLVLAPFAETRDYRVWLAQSKASSGASGR